MNRTKTKPFFTALFIGLGFLLILSVDPGVKANAQTTAQQDSPEESAAFSINGFVKDASGVGISGVTVDFSGLRPSVTTDGNGFYTQSGFADGGSIPVHFGKTGYSFSPVDDNITAADVPHNATGYLFNPVGLPFSDGFESGNLGPAWAIETDKDGRVRVGTNAPHSGSFSALLDDSVISGESFASIILALDLSTHSNVALSFWYRDFNDEFHEADGVFISDDYGVNWFRVYSFNNNGIYEPVFVDLDAAVFESGMSLNDHFLIKFQFFDTNPIPEDGYAIDDVVVSDYQVNGYVRNAAGTGMGGVTVSFDSAIAPVVTAADGFYSQKGFGAGNHLVTFSRTGYSFSPTTHQVTTNSAFAQLDSTGYPFNPASLPFTDDFDSMTLGSAWAIETDFEGRVVLSGDYAPPDPPYALLLDDSVSGSFTSHASAILSLDMTGQGNTDLTFWYRAFNDEPHADDGIFISDNYGATWYKAFSFDGSVSTYTFTRVDLDRAASKAGMSFNDHFLVKFQFYDNDPITDDGYGIDGIFIEHVPVILFLPLIFK